MRRELVTIGDLGDLNPSAMFGGSTGAAMHRHPVMWRPRTRRFAFHLGAADAGGGAQDAPQVLVDAPTNAPVAPPAPAPAPAPGPSTTVVVSSGMSTGMKVAIAVALAAAGYVAYREVKKRRRKSNPCARMAGRRR